MLILSRIVAKLLPQVSNSPSSLMVSAKLETVLIWMLMASLQVTTWSWLPLMILLMEEMESPVMTVALYSRDLGLGLPPQDLQPGEQGLHQEDMAQEGGNQTTQ